MSDKEFLLRIAYSELVHAKCLQERAKAELHEANKVLNSARKHLEEARAVRSKTFPGIAEAMAEQWGSL